MLLDVASSVLLDVTWCYLAIMKNHFIPLKIPNPQKQKKNMQSGTTHSPPKVRGGGGNPQFFTYSGSSWEHAPSIKATPVVQIQRFKFYSFISNKNYAPQKLRSPKSTSSKSTWKSGLKNGPNKNKGLELPTSNHQSFRCEKAVRFSGASLLLCTGDLSVEDWRSYHNPNSKHSYIILPQQENKTPREPPPFSWGHFIYIYIYIHIYILYVIFPTPNSALLVSRAKLFNDLTTIRLHQPWCPPLISSYDLMITETTKGTPPSSLRMSSF